MLRRPRDKRDYAELQIVRNFKTREKLLENVLNEKGDLRVALIFPNQYEIAASNLGFQIVWKLFNSIDRVVCERFFYDENFEKFYSLESQTPLDEFSVWAFCVHFENDLLNILKILESKAIPLTSKDRRSFDPLIVFGGALTYVNLGFLQVIPDVVLHGDFEPMVEKLSEVLTTRNRYELLERFTSLEFATVNPLSKKANNVARAPDLSKHLPISPVIASVGEFAGRILVEVERGCIWNCKFCMMSSCKKPTRFLNKQVLFDLIDKGFNLGLVASNVTDYPWLEEIIQWSNEKNVWVSVSSLRLDKLDEELLSYLRRHQRSFTIAPEAATFKIRQIIGKSFTDSQIEQALVSGRKAGFSEVKLYFMYGFDEEDEADLSSIGKLTSEIYRMGYTNVRLSLNAFVPKIGTELGNRKMQDLKTLKRKIRIVKSSLPSQCQATVESIKQLQIQYVINQAPEWAWERFFAEVGKLDENYRKEVFEEMLFTFLLDPAAK